MERANIHDRASVERIYPRQAFEQDVAGNARDKTTVMRGVKILSEPDGDGGFCLGRASQHIGERDPEGDSIFLVPQLRECGEAASGTAYGDSGELVIEGETERADDYRRFIDDVVEVARGADFKTPIGRGEERLKGFHGG